MTTAVLDPAEPVLRLAPCPQCADRRRTLVECVGGMRGHCLGCGRQLTAPLATESIGGASSSLVPSRPPRHGRGVLSSTS